MAFVFNFPDVGEGIEEGRIVEWLVAEGQTVTVDQPLVKVETDKAVVELPSPRAGTVVRLHHEAGAEIHVGDPLVTLAEAGEETVSRETAAAPSREGAASGEVFGEPEARAVTAARETAPVEATAAPEASAPSETPATVPASPPVPEEAPATTPSRRPLATPRTRALARELGVDLGTVRGTGPAGRITDEDVRRAQAAADAPAGPAPPERPAATPASRPARATRPAAPATAAAGERRVPLTHLRKVIARSMREAKDTAAHVTHVDEADVTAMLALHATMKADAAERLGVRLTLLPLFVRALVAALEDHPELNARVDEEAGEMVFPARHDIGIAVDTEEGLIVPVVRDAGSKSLLELAVEIADLAERARRRELGLEELRGGTCTITNIGPLGGVFATPIIPVPQLSIVGLHTIKERAVVVDGEIVVRKMMYLSVSFDHRWIDGAQAARFMTDLVRLVENPALLMARM
ncbi:MAG TPA: 2-oxo acid dehydrogenase subunit E2 [Acidobacteria bacterium]|nr:2-oxo acid dehydrogenase subunit E2 [Acidobacteriota bacterium]